DEGSEVFLRNGAERLRLEAAICQVQRGSCQRLTREPTVPTGEQTASVTLPVPMRSIVLTLLLALVWCDAAFAAGDDDWPCFLQQDGPRFVAGLDRDFAMMRQGLVDKILGDLHANDLQCPDFDRAYALFRHDVTSLFDGTISKEIVLDRLRRRWKK